MGNESFGCGGTSNTGRITLAWRLNHRHVELESDSKQLVHILRGEQKTPIEVEVIVGDILYLTSHIKVNIKFVRRAINKAAHVIAHWEHMGSIEAKWLFTPPFWLIPAL
ncbi:hypothetical protein LIER_39361 [Lithospermum erythrorhizon]|uniref:RNase H type-1 domain-containing protein n=1 Tax=Lithospermum erythrorhizon TaxID=34254 RepID=A0AAV3QHN8_LITER